MVFSDECSCVLLVFPMSFYTRVWNSGHDKVIKSTHAWLTVYVFRSNNLLSPWHFQGGHWKLNISKTSYLHIDLCSVLAQSSSSMKPVLFKWTLEFSTQTIKESLLSPLHSMHWNANPCFVGIQEVSVSM